MKILAPVAGKEMLEAAIHNGAHAVYVGAPGFNARGKTPDFSEKELKDIIDTAHRYRVQVYIAFNILIFEEELATAVQVLKNILQSGADAVIIQDIGLASLLREISPKFPWHASTQMTVTHPEAVKLLMDLSPELIVLPREFSLDEIYQMRESTHLQLETFIHGALCISYSGQCLTSESFGGRSANRGVCAQSCRLGYELFVNGQTRPTPGPYLLSPRDLGNIPMIHDYERSGADVVKIEGRYKPPEYVAAAVSEAVKILHGSNTYDEYAIRMTFARDLSPGWIHGPAHQSLVNPRFQNHLGAFAGTLLTKIKGLEMELQNTGAPVKPGMGISVRSGDTITGGTIVYTRFYRDSLFVRIHEAAAALVGNAGDSVYITSDPETDKRLRASYSSPNLHRIPVSIELSGKPGEPLQAVATVHGHSVHGISSLPIEVPEKHSLSEEKLREEFGKLGRVYILHSFSTRFPKPVFLRANTLKELRQNLFQKMDAAVTQSRSFRMGEAALSVSALKQTELGSSVSKLNLLLRNPDQLSAVLNKDFGEVFSGIVYLDFEYGRDLLPALSMLKDRGISVGIATSRILKPGEENEIEQILKMAPDSILVRNLAALEILRHRTETPLTGDFSLNMANHKTVDYFFQKGIQRFTPSYDLDENQLLSLLQATPHPAEIVIHQYMPAFHMEYCLYAAHLTNAEKFPDCKEACRENSIHLKDRTGMRHYVKTDRHCRNTLFTGKAQSALFLWESLPHANLTYRIEALDEKPEILAQKVSIYGKVITGIMSLEEGMQSLGLTEKYGLSGGTFHRTRGKKN